MYLQADRKIAAFDMIGTAPLNLDWEMLKDVVPDAPVIILFQDPVSRFASAWQSAAIRAHRKKWSTSTESTFLSLDAFLLAPQKYLQQLPPKLRLLLANGQAANLGMGDVSASVGQKNAADHARQIVGQVRLVAIQNHLEESLVMIRRVMCWTLDDIAIFSRNSGHVSSRARASLSKKNVAKIQHINQLDDAMFNVFNKTFWERISREIRFQDEMERFVPARREATANCARQVDPAASAIDLFPISHLSPSASHTAPTLSSHVALRSLRKKHGGVPDHDANHDAHHENAFCVGVPRAIHGRPLTTTHAVRCPTGWCQTSGS